MHTALKNLWASVAIDAGAVLDRDRSGAGDLTLETSGLRPADRSRPSDLTLAGKKGVIGAETAMADENEGRYAMGGVLGAGSFGSVHRAVDKHIGQAVAIKNGKHFTEADTKTVMRRLLAIIAALHDCGVAHCDIKPANLMLETPGNLDSLKLIDLGFASDLRKTAQLSVSQGTALYLAPELVRVFRSPDQKGHYGLQVDEWAAGVTMYRLLCGR
eukprot:jgi/Tetstr1/456662/TSEL_043363.t1